MMRVGTSSGFVLALALTACAPGTIVEDKGCKAYGESRAPMPPLGEDALGNWVADLDEAMTKVCFQRLNT